MIHIPDQRPASEDPSDSSVPALRVAASDPAVYPAAQGRHLLGYITAARQEVRPFTDKQIALLREFRRAGGHRDRECAALDRDARGIGAADRDRRGVAGHQLLARRPRPRSSTRCSTGQYGFARRRMVTFLTYDGECFHPAADSGEPHYIEWCAASQYCSAGANGPAGTDQSRRANCSHCRSPRRRSLSHRLGIPRTGRYQECSQPNYSRRCSRTTSCWAQ